MVYLLDTHSIEINGKEYLALEPDQVICYEGYAKLTVLAGCVKVNGYQLSCEQKTSCVLKSPSGFPCHAVHAAKKPLLFTEVKPPLVSQGQKEAKDIAKRSALQLEDRRTLIQFLRRLTKAEESIVSVLQLEEHCDDVNRLLSGTCGLGNFFSRDSRGGQSAPGSDADGTGSDQVDGAVRSASSSATADSRAGHDGEDDEEAAAPLSSRRLWPGFALCSRASCSRFTFHTPWKQTIKSITSHSGPTSAMVCGGTNVGKSSFGRLLVNSLLNSHERVVFIETDVGQTELSPPAMLSLHCLTRPLIGPPFCHQVPAEMSIFFGDVSPANQPDFYVRCVCRLVDRYLEKYFCLGVPLVVNTHGWVRGLGITLVREVYRLVRPSHLVIFKPGEHSKVMPANWLDGLSDNIVINEAASSSSTSTSTSSTTSSTTSSSSSHQDFACSSSLETKLGDVATAAGAGAGEEEGDEEVPMIDLTVNERSSPPAASTQECQLYYIQAHESSDKTRSIQSKTHRHLAVVAALAHTLQLSHQYERELSSPVQVHAALLLRSVPCKEIAWKQVAVHVMHASVPRSQILHVLNGSLVALARVEDKSELIDVGGEQYVYAPRFISSNPVAHCVGLAVIRAIDPERKLFQVCTSLTDEELQSVDLILKGRLELADSFLQDSQHSRQSVPYMSSDFSQSITGAGAMKHRKNLKRR
ncbi:polynucleotide 5'-hydroxyl-kinase NOL9-like [Sycon ciliatum]|uniref:polynucleotide 5'-hydroxyl-kinase NOL9-like n=1 Tax=Sycon ciliatum TaxID=27933 RepID=UPI0031F68E4C